MPTLPKEYRLKISFEEMFLNAIRERRDYEIILGEIIYLVKTNQIEELKNRIHKYQRILDGKEEAI